MHSSQDQSASPNHLQTIREEYIDQISLYGKARCRFEIRLMAGEVRKMDVGQLLLLKRKENSDDGGADCGGKSDDDDDALLLAKASDVHVLVPPAAAAAGAVLSRGIREHRQSLITDEHLPTRPRIPLAQPERRLSVPIELLTKEWPQLTTQQGAHRGGGTVGNNLTTTTTTTLVSRPGLVYLPTTTTRHDSCVDMPNNDLLDDDDQPSRLHLRPGISSSYSSSFAHTTAPIFISNNNPQPNFRDDEDDEDDFSFSSSNIIPFPLPPPPPPPPPSLRSLQLPDFEYGDLIRQLRPAAAAAAARRLPKNNNNNNNNNNIKQKYRAGEIIQPVAHPFSPPCLHRVVRLTPRQHDRLQHRLSRQWLIWLLFLFGLPCPWLLLLFGYGMMDGLAEWLTEGDVIEFGKREKKVGQWAGFVVLGLWIIIGVGIGVGVSHHHRNA